MIIYDKNGNPIIGLEVDDSSYRYREIMGECKVYLEFSLTQHVELEIGSFVDFQGERYTLMAKPDVTIEHNRHYSYKITLEGQQVRFAKYVVHNPVDGRLVFPMMATPAEHLAMIVQNLTEREGTVQTPWSVGTVIDGPQKEMQYNYTKLSDALTALANLYDTEWEVVGKAIHLRKVEYNTNDPLALGYGRNQGFKSGVGSTNYGETGQIERLFIQGSDRNISLKEYGSSTLLLPKNFHFQFDGTKFRYQHNDSTIEETGFNSSKAVQMKTDENGFSVMLEDASSSCNEDSLDVTDVYPKRVGEVTGVMYEYDHGYYTYAELSELDLDDDDWLSVQVDIIDATLPADLDYDACQMENGEPMIVIFQTGMLAGREFEVKKFHKQAQMATVNGQSVVRRPANRFELVRATFNDIDMPNNTFRPNASSGGSNDTYIVTNVYLPDAYIVDKATTSGAEFDALRQAAKYLFKNKDIQVTFKGTIDDLFSKRNWTTIGGKLKLGGAISFHNESIQPTALVTRIVAVKDFINDPYSPEVTLSNESVKGGLSSRLSKISSDSASVRNQTYALERYAKRSFRDAKETMAALEEALLDGFTERISPIAIQTMQLLLGDESLQFRYVNSKTTPQQVSAGISYNPSTKKLVCNAGIIQHMTLGINTMSNAHAASEYKFWDIDAFESPYLGDALSSKKYYLYAKCNKATEGQEGYQAAEYVLTDTAIALEGVSGYYHFLVGILNSEYDDDRSFVTLFGFTEILPGRITTDKIVSSDGTTFWDLVQKVIDIGGRLHYDPTNGLILHGALVQTGSGETTVLGAWCGEFNGQRRYSLGDEVWWQAADGTISTYRYVNSVPSDEVVPPYPLPSNNGYWQFVAKGVKGDTGNAGSFKSTAFLRTNDIPSTPTGGTYSSPVPTSKHTDTASSALLPWSDGIPAGDAILWASTCVFNSNGTNSGWTTPRQMTDTDTFDVEFAKMQTNDSTPATPSASNMHGGSGAQVWFDPDLDSSEDFTQMYWRAERECINGVWGNWVIVRIKGESGNNGSDGKGIVSTSITYAVSSSGTTPPVGENLWKDSLDEISIGPGYYVWTRTIITYSDNSTSTSYSVSYSGTNGSNGYSTKFLYKSQDEKPSAPTGTNPSPTGWSEDSAPVKASSSISNKNYFGDWLTRNVGIAVLFKRSSSIPSIDWSGSLTFSFTNGGLSSVPDGWSQTIPEGEDDLYVSWAVVAGTGSGQSIPLADWSTPVLHNSSGLNIDQPYKISSAKKSDEIDNNESTLEKVFFETAKDNTFVKINCIVASESGYDNLYVGKLDQHLVIDQDLQVQVSNYEYELSSDVSGVPLVVSIELFVKRAGIHSLEFAFVKDDGESATDFICFNLASSYYERKVWMTSCRVHNGIASNWTQPICINGNDGANGEDGPAAPYRGDYDPDETYFGSQARTDIVSYINNGTERFYRANPCVGGAFKGIIPTNTAYWMDFGANFSSVATGLLFAKLAYINHLGARNIAIRDHGGNVVGGMVDYDSVAGNTPWLWLGGATPLSSPFRVNGSGHVYAERGVFSGYLQTMLKTIEDSISDEGSTYNSSTGVITLNEDLSIVVKSKGDYTVSYETIIQLPLNVSRVGQIVTLWLAPPISRMDGIYRIRVSVNSQCLLHKSKIDSNGFYDSFRYIETNGGFVQLLCVPSIADITHVSWLVINDQLNEESLTN